MGELVVLAVLPTVPTIVVELEAHLRSALASSYVSLLDCSPCIMHSRCTSWIRPGKSAGLWLSSGQLLHQFSLHASCPVNH